MELETRIEHANLHGVLDLHSMGLKVYPKRAILDSGVDLSDLSELNLSKNKLTRLPEDVCAFHELEVLNCHHNQICGFPRELVHLSQLTELNLSRNDITDLPAAVCQLPLVKFNVSSNQLKELPRDLSDMTTLVELDVNNNRLTELPTLCGLTSLVKLNLARNDLQTLHRDIGQLSELVSLKLSGNQLGKLPLTIRQLNSLETFELDDNPLIEPPFDVCLRGRVHIFQWMKEKAKQSKSNPMTDLGLFMNDAGSTPEVTDETYTETVVAIIGAVAFVAVIAQIIYYS